MSTKKNSTKKSAKAKAPAAAKPAKAKPAKSLAALATHLTPPAPDALRGVATFDKKAKMWDGTIAVIDTNEEVHAFSEPFKTDDDAMEATGAWLLDYKDADDAKRRKMLGWKKAEPAAETKPAADDAGEAKDAPTTPKAKRARKPKADGEGRKPSGLDVAADLLKKAGTPMNCKDLVEKMLADGLWSTNGKTPAATIYAAIIREIADKGKAARFKKTDRGSFEYHEPAAA